MREFIDMTYSIVVRRQKRRVLPIPALPYWVQPAPKNAVAERNRIWKESLQTRGVIGTIVDFSLYHLYKRYTEPVLSALRFRTPETPELTFVFSREKFLFGAAIISVTAFFAFNSMTANASIQLHSVQTRPFQPSTVVSTPQATKWLDGIPESNGFRKDALSGPFRYAKDSGYEFAATKERLLELVKEGTLVELEETESLKFNNVSRPYALPVVAEFVYRIADQYNYGQRCGPLWLNGAARDIAFQQTLGNGSAKSVHPTGMPIDLKSTGHTPRCRDWLENTLLEIEAAKRIDFTKERSPAHYHISVATHEYEAWLERRRTVADSETDWLRKALFYEGGPKETVAGYRAIAWVIRNRARSVDYPNTIAGVVADGSTGKHDGGCQFTFMCDGKPEDRYELCRTESGKLTSYWRHKCDMRWEQVTMIAKAVMSETNDPTDGAVLYYAAWMPKAPDWVVDMKRGTINTIGSHVFACSTKAGRGVCAIQDGGKS